MFEQVGNEVFCIFNASRGWENVLKDTERGKQGHYPVIIITVLSYGYVGTKTTLMQVVYYVGIPSWSLWNKNVSTVHFWNFWFILSSIMWQVRLVVFYFHKT